METAILILSLVCMGFAFYLLYSTIMLNKEIRKMDESAKKLEKLMAIRRITKYYDNFDN